MPKVFVGDSPSHRVANLIRQIRIFAPDARDGPLSIPVGTQRDPETVSRGELKPARFINRRRRCAMSDASQFSTDRTCPGRWTITFSNPPINMFLPTTIVELESLMTDIEADPSVKVVLFQSANRDFFIAHLDVSVAAQRPE